MYSYIPSAYELLPGSSMIRLESDRAFSSLPGYYVGVGKTAYAEVATALQMEPSPAGAFTEPRRIYFVKVSSQVRHSLLAFIAQLPLFIL